MPIRHKKEKEKGDIKHYEHDKFTSRSSKGDTTPNTRRIERMSLEICMNLSEMFSFFIYVSVTKHNIISNKCINKRR